MHCIVCRWRKSGVIPILVREEGKSTLEEVRVVVHAEGMAGAAEKIEQESRVLTVERAGVEKNSDSTAGTTAICDICMVPRGCYAGI